MHRILGFLVAALLFAGCSSNSTMSSTSNSTTSGSGSGSGSGTSTSSSTFVYIANSPSSGKYQISGYTVSSAGALTPISSSPYPTTGYGPLLMAGHGSYLFGADGYTVYSFSIASDGSLKRVSSMNVGTLSNTGTSGPTGGPAQLFYDRGYNTLYSYFINLAGTDNSGYQAYAINTANGQLSIINSAGASPALAGPLQFIGNDQFAYTSNCYHGTPTISGFSRDMTGALTGVSGNSPFPSPTPPSGDSYCPYEAAADNANHVVVSVGATPPASFSPTGPYQLATYTVDNTGTLTTTSTAMNMPATQVGQPNTYLFSADGKYLAVGGPSGLGVYSNNNGTLTAVGGLLNSDNINQVEWDANDHLYALSTQSNQLYIYTVSTTGATAVSGSPYSTMGATGLAVVAGS